MKEYGTDRVEGLLSTKHKNYYAQLCKLDDKETKIIEIAVVGFGIAGRFDHNNELKVMEFKEERNRPASNK